MMAESYRIVAVRGKRSSILASGSSLIAGAERVECQVGHETVHLIMRLVYC
jgi:hypothetical protein